MREGSVRSMGELRLLCLLAAGTLAALPAAAQVTHYVPAEWPTIQAAIDVAVAGDAVLVAPGTYVERIDFAGKTITVRSEGGAEATTIQAGDPGPVVSFTAGEGRGSVLAGFTITGGRALSGSPSTEGGGVRISSSSPTVRDNRIVGNAACSGGGGVVARFSSALIEANVIEGNFQSGCSGGTGGGGVLVIGAGATEIVGNVIVDNSWGSDGGGISLWAAGDPVLRDNWIEGNLAGGAGGGIYLANRADALIVQNVIVGNQAVRGGGVRWLTPSGTRGPFLVNNTVVDNSAGLGSAVYADGYDAQARLVNNILQAAAGQTALHCGDFNDLQPPVIRFNDVFAPGGSAYGGICADLTGMDGNISVPPGFVDEAARDLRLAEGSPAIDAGDDLEPNLPAIDWDGEARPADGDGDGIAVIDLGYDEVVRVNEPPVAAFTVACVDRDCVFTSTGSDPDGTIVGWSWDFGDGQGAAAEHPSHGYAAVGSYPVTLTVTDDRGATASASREIPVTDRLHVGAIDLAVREESKGFKLGIATVMVLDSAARPVAGAVVTGTFAGDFAGTVSGTTGADGVAVLEIGPKKGRANFTFCVDGITAEYFAHDASADVESCDTAAK